jgi:hypothetical protein
MTETPAPLLYSFDGQPGPDELAPALRGLLELPESVQSELGSLLGPCLEPLPEDQLENRIGRLCRRHELDPRVVVPAFKAVVVLFRSAVAEACGPEEMAQDLRAIDASGRVEALLSPIYGEAFPQLRMRIAQESIAAHGPVATGIEWRMDTLGSSSRGKKLNVPVALMTFGYQRAGQSDSFTIQMLPDAVARLRDICDTLLNRE